MDTETKETIEIEGIAQGGDGVGHLEDGRVVFVERTLPGERVRVRLVEDKDTFARGELEEVVEAAEARVDSDCPHFDRCGGCQFWHTGYEHELQWKTEAAREAIARISGLESLPEPVVQGAPEDRRYRNTATFHRRRLPADRDAAGGSDEDEGEERRWGVGFFARNSHELVEVPDCPITATHVCEARRAAEDGLEGFDDVDLMVESADDSSAVITIGAEDIDKPPRSLWELAEGLEAVPSIRGVRVVGGDREWEAGDCSVDGDQVMAELPVESLRMPAGLFRQANPAVNRQLVESVREIVEDHGGGTVLELFAGVGNLSFGIHESVDALLGMEIAESAVEMGNTIAEFAGIEPVMFREADLAEGFEMALEPPERGIFEQIVLDPPRGGASEVCRELADLREDTSVHTITYVSCDPPALGRDLETLADGGWEPVDMRMLDMFPRTAHVEVVTVLERPG